MPHGRAGADGFAVSLVTPDTRNLLRNIQKFTGQEIPEMNFEVSADAFEPVEGADERLLADDESYFFEEKKGRGKKGGKSRGEGKFDRGKGKGGKKGGRKRDLERSAEHKRKLEAEANGEEYIPANPHHNNGGEKKRSLSERQAAADAAYAAMFDTPNMEGGKKKSKKRDNGEGGYSYDSFSKKGGAKGKPGKRSRMANHDDRDLDGFRNERRGGGRVRKYNDRDERRGSNDRNGSKAWQLGYPAQRSLSRQLLRRRARQPRRTRQEVRRQAVLRRPRQQARQEELRQRRPRRQQP